MITQVIKSIEVLSIIATVRSQIYVNYITTKMVCGLKSPPFADAELSECRKFESVDWHKAGL